jgi:hypothetical protein
VDAEQRVLSARLVDQNSTVVVCAINISIAMGETGTAVAQAVAELLRKPEAGLTHCRP